MIHAPTNMVWLIGRTYAGDQADLPAAQAYQRQLDLRPLSRLHDTSFQSIFVGSGMLQKPTLYEVMKGLGPEAYFERFMTLTEANPPAPQDAPFIKNVLEPLGLTPGHPEAWANLGFLNRYALTIGFNQTIEKVNEQAAFSSKNVPVTSTNWAAISAKYSELGNYGTDYRFRAGVVIAGLGANESIDAVYPNVDIDGNGNAMDGSKEYRITFPAGTEPPVRGFWSITLYDDQGYLVANPINRYAIRSSDHLVYKPDGSLVLYLQPNDPGPDHRANWLPTPSGKTFELTLRAYWPDESILSGKWIPPAVEPVQ